MNRPGNVQACGGMTGSTTFHPVYRRPDTHRNKFGAPVAYNAVATALGEAADVLGGG